MDKQKINYLLILLFCMFLLNSCKKYSNEYTEVEFVIVNPANDKPFEGIPVQISLSKATNKGIKDGGEFYNGVTDANGRVSFKFKAREGGDFWYVPSADFSSLGPPQNYEIIVRPVPGALTIKKDQYNEMRYEITYFAYLREKYINSNCEGSTDTLFLDFYPSIEYGSLSNIRHIEWAGCGLLETEGGIDESPDGYFRVFTGKNKYEWEVHRPSGITYGSDSIYLEKGEMGTIEIDY